MRRFPYFRRVEIERLYEDEWIVAVNKPSNLLVHHSYYARNIEETSLTELLRSQFQQAVFPVHRLDRKTSGVILFAKNQLLVPDFQALFTLSQIEKKYEALLRGHTPDELLIDSPVKNERGNYRDAETKLRTIRKFELDIPVIPYDVSRYSLVEFTPLTGRMHQLRKHANKISHPIIGDPKYGNRHHNHMFSEQLGINELFLHACSLRFRHPVTGKNLVLNAKKPDFWSKFFNVARSL